MRFEPYHHDGPQLLHERRDAVLALITTNHATTEEMS
jgi:hypothetical protein